MTTYTVYSAEHGSEYGRGLTARQAAELRLNNSRETFEMRADTDYPGAWSLMVSDHRGRMVHCHNGIPGERSLIRDYADNIDAAWGKLAEKIITADWPDAPAVMTDAGYDEMRAEGAAGEEEA